MSSIRETAEKFNIYGNFKGRIRLSEPMSSHTSFKVGGPAPLFIEPADVPSLIFAVRTLKDDAVPYFILGGGSNIVVSDRGFNGAVIFTGGINAVTDCSGFVTCGAGAPMSYVVDYCTAHALPGLEKFAGLPGTAGGALYMNARCFGLSVSDVLVSVEYIDTVSLETVSYVPDPADWDYKKSPFQPRDKGSLQNAGRIITKAVFRTIVPPGVQKESIEAECRKYVGERVSKGHFRYPSAGSVFRNNHSFGKPSGSIIDEAGLCGYEIGGAQIAPWHGNFIINKNNATESDIKTLVNYIISTIREKTGFTLEPEIIFCGIE
jgi:UDP-N-acetylmuramate dehydrogenase